MQRQLYGLIIGPDMGSLLICCLKAIIVSFDFIIPVLCLGPQSKKTCGWTGAAGDAGGHKQQK